MNPFRDLGGLPARRSSSRPYRWDPALVEELIADNRAHGFRPAFLMVGRREATLLRRHLGITFGPPAAQSLENTYYLGLRIVEDRAESLLCVAGRLSLLPPSTSQHARPARNYFGPFLSHPRWGFTG